MGGFEPAGHLKDFHNQLQFVENEFKQKFVEKKELQKFKIGAIRYWIYKTATKIPIAPAPRTLAEKNHIFATIADLPEQDNDLPEGIVSPATKLAKKTKAKSRK